MLFLCPEVRLVLAIIPNVSLEEMKVMEWERVLFFSKVLREGSRWARLYFKGEVVLASKLKQI